MTPNIIRIKQKQNKKTKTKTKSNLLFYNFKDINQFFSTYCRVLCIILNTTTAAHHTDT